MIPLEEVRKIIPEDALKLLQETFSPAIYNKILLSFRLKRNTCFRINTLKSKNDILSELRKEGYKLGNIHYLSGAYQLDANDDKRLLKSNFVTEGWIYLQSISSQIPVRLLDPQKNEKILDMAASPGSKTTQISALMANTGAIDAIEPDYIRMERLQFNAKNLGATNINFHKTDGANFCKDKAGAYDRVLADVPCSGEGRFSIHDKSSYGKWKITGVDKTANLQKKLLKSAIGSAKIGGIVVYSTCTLNAIENEQVIDWAIKQEDFKIKILPIDEKFKTLNESMDPILSFRNARYDGSINKCLRIIPSANLEGFFICRMQRVGK